MPTTRQDTGRRTSREQAALATAGFDVAGSRCRIGRVTLQDLPDLKVGRTGHAPGRDLADRLEATLPRGAAS